MTDIVYSRHAETRMQQRGIRSGDIPLILACATQIDDETWFVRKQDVKREIDNLKREIQTLERLTNKKLVVRNRRVITIYHSRHDDQKRTLRHGRWKGLVN